MAATFRRFATDDVMETFAFIGSPARMLGRFPLISRYLWSGFARPWYSHPYAEVRWGKSYRWRFWLLFDMLELQMIEQLINEASDKRVQEFRQHQLESLNMISVVAALVSGVALTALQLPGMDGVSYVAHGAFSLALIISLLSTFFTCLQQRTYGFVEEPGAIRAWLSNGVRYIDYDGKEVYQSSSVSHNLLQIPFELLCISITAFLIGFSVYLGSAWKQKLPLGLATEQNVGNGGVLVAFILGTTFSLILLGQILGTKDVERNRFLNHNPDGSIRYAKEGGGVPPTLEQPSISPAGVAATQRPKRPEASEALASNETLGGLERTSELAKALKRAAEAHREAASADAEVARLLELVS